MAHGRPDNRRRGDPSDTFHLISAGSTNASSVKASAGVVTSYYFVNIAATFRYVKLYNKASSPTVGTDVPRCVYGIPPLSAANVAFPNPIDFETGIALAITVGIADSDATAVGANEVAVTLNYQ